MPEVNYLPVQSRMPDNQYFHLLKKIRLLGEREMSTQEVECLTYMAPGSMRFKLENGFPMITERSIKGFWKAAAGEIFAFVNGVRNDAGLKKFGCGFWENFVTPEKCGKRGLEAGDLGPGSYGAAFHDFPTAEGIPFNQFAALIQQMKERPGLRTHFVSPWIPQYTYRISGRKQQVVVAPCHGWIHFRIINGKLSMHMFQRSGDCPVGIPSNMVQYGCLMLAVAHLTNSTPHEYIHTISDAHIYVDQLEFVSEMLSRSPRVLPTMKLVNPPDNIFDFRKEHFELSDYDPHPAIKGIPVAI
jgi:thymidylate synthase